MQHRIDELNERARAEQPSRTVQDVQGAGACFFLAANTSHMLHAKGARFHIRIFDYHYPHLLPRAARLMDRKGLHDCLILCVLPAQPSQGAGPVA